MLNLASTLGHGDAFSSVLSSLQNQRRRLEVISTNVSNINTIGFKSTRMTFLEQLDQSVGKLYTPFEQGSFTASGSPTDLAINGESFFVVRTDEDRDQILYTRAGSFYFDSEGKLVTQDKDAVQGWLLNNIVDDDESEVSISETGASGAVENIVFDPDMTVGALATNSIWLGGNLNAGLQMETNVMSLTQSFTTMDGVVTVPAEIDTKLVDLNEAFNLQSGVIEMSGTNHNGEAVGNTLTVDDTTTLADLVTLVEQTFPDTTVVLENGMISMTDTANGDSQTDVTWSFIQDSDPNTGTMALPVFVNTVSGYTPKADTSIVTYDSFGTAHHLTIEFEKTGANDREWAWKITAGDDETFYNNLDSSWDDSISGKLTFDSAGKFISWIYDDGTATLKMNPGNGSDELNIMLNIGGDSSRAGMTQYNDVTLMTTREQDGRTSGKLEGISVDRDGFLLGSFSNGVLMQIAQVALAEFADPTSLQKVGASNFAETNFSGEAEIGHAADFDTDILSGHLETSNVDLADQFIQMIDAQKGYSAASRIVSTLDKMLDETTRFGR